MIGREIGNYRITELIGEGGMGLVYLAEHATIDRKVAVKVLRNDLPASAELVRRFVNEARIAATIRHPNVIEVFDTGMLVPEGVPYIVMELLEGESLAARLARVSRLEIADATLWTYETAAALGVAHAKGVIHRDLKPGNLYLVADDRQPEREKIKVLDFGIAKLRGSLASFGSQTQTGSIMGTPIYMSPEQCRGLKDIDSRSDIYSLGIILYEMLCGAPPFVSPGFGELLSMHLMTPPAPPRSHNPNITERLERVILTALAKNPEDRFATVGEFQAALGFEPSRVGPTANAIPAVTPARGLAPTRPSSPVPTLASAVTNPPAPATASTHPPSLAPASAPRSITPAATSSAPRSTRPSGGTQISNASIMMTPAAGLPIASAPGGGGAPKSKRLRLPLVIAFGVVAVAGIVLAFIGGQLGPRLRCLTGKSCTELGDCYDGGRCGIAKDRERACELYDKDCTAGHMASCVRFGHCYEAHTGGIQANWTRACDLYQKACDADDLSGCAHWADCLREGIGGRQKQAKRSCDFAQRACDGGEMYGCVGVGLCEQGGLGDVAKNESEACRLYQRSCDAGEQVGCARLGLCHRGNSPEGFTRSDEAACQVFKKSCDEGGALSCSYLAGCYRDGSGGLPQNDTRACDLFSKACDDSGFSERVGCDGWAACLRQGPGGYPKNVTQADRIDERVCSDGDAQACAALAASRAAPVPVPVAAAPTVSNGAPPRAPASHPSASPPPATTLAAFKGGHLPAGAAPRMVPGAPRSGQMPAPSAPPPGLSQKMPKPPKGARDDLYKDIE